ncbi:MAG: hypothetical protein Q9174_000558 [Haloplaca sp. 1 TL-2023]
MSQSTFNLTPKAVKKITCLGSGFVGGPTSAVIALKSNVEVTVVDINPDRIAAWRSDALPIYEPGLQEAVQAARDGILQGHLFGRQDRAGTLHSGHAFRTPSLFFSTDVDQAIMNADLIFVCVNTPTKSHGIGKGSAADLGFVEAATRSIARVARNDKIVVEKSTVPCRTAQSIREILAANANPGVRFDVLSNPEFLAEGTAIRDLLYPDRILIGSTATPEGYRAASSLAEVYAQWVPRDRIISMNLWSSELSKLAANALLAQRISSVNALSAICEATGADVDEVSRACGMDSRIGPQMLKAGPGFGGSCFQKDIFNIVYLSESLHLYEVADYWRAIINMNEHQKQRFTKRIISCLYNNLAGKKLAVLGFAFKKDTNDTRESPAITLVCNFVAERAQVAIYDPQVPSQQIWRELMNSGCDVDILEQTVTICPTAYTACDNADAVVLVTEWDEFSNKSATSAMTTTGERHPLAILDMNRTSEHASSGMADRPASSPLNSPSEASAGFRLPSRRSLGITIKDPNSGEIKNFDGRRSPSVHSGLRSSLDPSFVAQPTFHQSAGQASIVVDYRLQDHENTSRSIFSKTSAGPTMPANRNTNENTAHVIGVMQRSTGATSAQRQATHIAQGPACADRLDWARIAQGMRKPMFVFDGRNMLDHGKLAALGFHVEAIGKRGRADGEQLA